MKTLLLIRHAKSAGQFSASSDFKRELNEQGMKQAPRMAHYILMKQVAIDLFVSSPATRAKTTALLFMKEFNRNEEELFLIEALYAATTETFSETVTALDDRYNNIALFSHNPGITDYAASLSAVHIDNMPTCAVFAVSAPITRWKDFDAAVKTFLFFEYPKGLD